MKCSDMDELISAYANDELSDTQREFVDEHLSHCPHCRETLAACEKVKQSLVSLRDFSAPTNLTETTMAKIKSSTAKNHPRSWLRPVMTAGAAVIILAILLVTQPWHIRSPEGITDPMMPPPLYVTIIPGIIFLVLLAGILMILGLALRNRLARALAGGASILYGMTGICFGLYALLVDTSDLFLVMGAIPIFGFIMGVVDIKRRASYQWAAITGIVLCLSALVLDAIFLITYPVRHIWVIIATVAIPISIITYAFYREIKNILKNWLRPAMAVGAAVIILAILLVTQPWGLTPQSVIVKAYAATANLQSYRMSSTLVSFFEGETSEQRSEWGFAFPDRYHGQITLKDESKSETYEFIVIGDKQYVRKPDNASGKLSIGVWSGFAPSKEHTLGILDSFIDLQKLPDEKIEGTDCLHYKGRVDTERKVEKLKAGLDPEEPRYEEKLKGLEALRTIKTEVELWIGKDDFLIRQMKSITESSVHGNAVVLVKFYDFNQPITIEPPTTASGELFPGWSLVDTASKGKEQVFSHDVTFSIVDEDLTHQHISFQITITNVSEETVDNIGVSLATMATNEGQWIWNSPNSITLEPGESKTYEVSWEYDATNTTKEELFRLVNLTTVLASYTTPQGETDVQLLFPDAPYPTKTPPEEPPQSN